MELDLNHWAIMGAPFVVLAGVIVFLIMRRHKETPPDDHILK